MRNFIVLIFLAAACGGSSGPAPVSTVTVAPATASIAVGATQSFAATPKDAHGNVLGGVVTWTSSDSTIATVDASGLATGVKSGGPVTITGAVGAIGGTAQLTVTATASLFSLTIDNFDAWCDVTAKVGTTTVASVTGSTTSGSISPQQPAGTTITLSATPHGGFTTAKWQGTTTASGDANGDATYVMTSAASQTVTACCPFSDGHGCPF